MFSTSGCNRDEARKQLDIFWEKQTNKGTNKNKKL